MSLSGFVFRAEIKLHPFLFLYSDIFPASVFEIILRDSDLSFNVHFVILRLITADQNQCYQDILLKFCPFECIKISSLFVLLAKLSLFQFHKRTISRFSSLLSRLFKENCSYSNVAY